MKYHEKKRLALLLAPQTERGYLRRAEGTPTLTVSDAYPDPFRTFSVTGNLRTDAPVSYPVREHTLTEDDTRALTAATTYTFACASVANKAKGMTWVAIATNYGYAVFSKSFLTDAILAANHHVVYRDTWEGARVYASADSTDHVLSVTATRLSPGVPLPEDALDITELCVSQRSFPASAAIPGGTPVYWSSGDTVLRLTAADRNLKTGEILCAETYGGAQSVTVGRQSVGCEVSSLPAAAHRSLQRATLTRQMLTAPHLQYTYYGMANPSEEYYYFELDEGYLILPQDMMTGTETRYVYDTFERIINVYEDDSTSSYSEVEDGFWRANELPAGMTAEANLVSVTETVLSYGEIMTYYFPDYSFAGKESAAGDVFYVRTLSGYLCIAGSVIQTGMTYLYDSAAGTLTRTPKAGGETETISNVFYWLRQEIPAGAKSIPYSSHNNNRKAEGWRAWRPCFLHAVSGTLYSVTPEFTLRPGLVMTLDEQTLAVTCDNGFTFTATPAADALASDIADSPNLYFAEWKRKCVVLSGDSRSYTASTPAPTHPATFGEAGGCTLTGGRGGGTLSFPQTVAGATPSAAFLLAGDAVCRDRFYKDKYGKISLESRIGRYVFTGEETPASVTATDNGYAVAYSLLDGHAADSGGIFCTHFVCQNTAAEAAQSVFCLTGGTAKSVFLLRKSEFPADSAEQAKQRFLAFLSASAAAGAPVTVLFRRAAPLSFDLTAEAAAFASLAPARGNGTLSFSAPDGGALPAAAEAVYYSRVKGT